MAMSDTEMALMMGANQLSAMRPVNPGAFSGVEAGMTPPPMGGAMSDREAMMMANAMPPGMPPQAMPPTGMPPGMPPQEMPMDEQGMMQYIQEKAKQIRDRMGSGAMSDSDMGALDAVMAAMPKRQTPTAPQMRPAPSGAMSNADMQMMMQNMPRGAR